MRGGRARALIGREVQLPRTLLRPLGWSDSAQSLYQTRLPSDPPLVLAVQHPRPHAPPSPPSPSLPPPPPPPLLLLPLLPVEFLSLSLEGPLPPLGQLMNCPLRPLSGFSWLRWPRSSALQGALTPWVCVCVCVCVCVFIKLHITTQSGPVILVILCHSH